MYLTIFLLVCIALYLMVKNIALKTNLDAWEEERTAMLNDARRALEDAEEANERSIINFKTTLQTAHQIAGYSKEQAQEAITGYMKYMGKLDKKE